MELRPSIELHNETEGFKTLAKRGGNALALAQIAYAINARHMHNFGESVTPVCQIESPVEITPFIADELALMKYSVNGNIISW